MIDRQWESSASEFSTYRWIKLLVPVGGVQKLTFEFLQTGNVGPFPLVQKTGACDENIGLIFNNSGPVKIQSQQLDHPLVSLFVPGSFGAFVTESDVFPDVVLGSNSFPVFQNLCSAGVELRPFGPRLVAQLVDVRGDICVREW